MTVDDIASNIISIHAPLTGSDYIRVLRHRICQNFNPRSPHRERQSICIAVGAGRDYFNPRSPHRERQLCAFHGGHSPLFQSTLPSQGATAIHRQRFGRRAFQSTLPSQGATGQKTVDIFPLRISIHAPLTGSDAVPGIVPACPSDFNPRSPHRERLSETA